MKDPGHCFKAIDQPRSRPTDEIIVERHDFLVGYGIDGIPPGTGCHLLRSDPTIQGISQQDDIRILDD